MYQPHFFSHVPSPPELYPLSLHDALPILGTDHQRRLGLTHEDVGGGVDGLGVTGAQQLAEPAAQPGQDRKSTRLNSSHVAISYAVFCLKKKKKMKRRFIQCDVQVLSITVE